MKSVCLLLFIISLLDATVVGKPKKVLDKFADRYNPDKAAQDPNKHAWKSCYEIKNKKCVSWGWTPIPKGCAVVFEKCNYLGTASIVCGDLKRLAKLNKKISSVKLGPNTGIELFSKGRHSGSKIDLLFNEPCLINQSFNSKAQSLKITVRST
jgi:hypothetical protein